MDTETYLNAPAAKKIGEAGGKIQFLVKPYEHAKATIVGDSNVYIGSVNYTEPSITKNRELGIIISQSDVVSEMSSEFAKFWAEGTPISQ